MVQIEACPRDPAAAWRVRDSLAAHPLLGGSTAYIKIVANHDGIVLEGWAIDEAVRALAVRMAQRVAGRRAVEVHMSHGANATQTRRLHDENARHMPR